jgi:hypothetical protein
MARGRGSAWTNGVWRMEQKIAKPKATGSGLDLGPATEVTKHEARSTKHEASHAAATTCPDWHEVIRSGRRAQARHDYTTTCQRVSRARAHRQPAKSRPQALPAQAGPGQQQKKQKPTAGADSPFFALLGPAPQ